MPKRLSTQQKIEYFLHVSDLSVLSISFYGGKYQVYTLMKKSPIQLNLSLYRGLYLNSINSITKLNNAQYPHTIINMGNYPLKTSRL